MQSNIFYKTKKLLLTQQPHIISLSHYGANAIDSEGTTYLVTWPITSLDIDNANEDEMCDWDNYKVEIN